MLEATRTPYPGVLTKIILAFALLTSSVLASSAAAQKLPGTTLNQPRAFQLGNDLGFGHTYKPSLADNYQDWGATVVSSGDGFPVRLGERSIRFETREGVCGWDGSNWSDCKNGRNRHELTTSQDPDPQNRDLWYALSLYVPEEFQSPRTIGTTMFQIWSGGLDSWAFKYDTGVGIRLLRNLDHADAVLVPDAASKGRWIDFL